MSILCYNLLKLVNTAWETSTREVVVVLRIHYFHPR